MEPVCQTQQFRGPNSCVRQVSRQAHQFRGSNSCERRASRHMHQKRGLNSCERRASRQTQQFRGSNSCERRASRQAHQFRGLNCYVRQVSRQAQQKRCPNSCVQRTEHVTARTHAPAPATREALLPHKASSKKRTRRKTRKSRNAHTIRDKRPTGSEFPRDACVAWERAPPRHAPRPHGPARLLSEHSSRMSAGPCGRGRAWAGPEPIRARRRPYRAGSTFRGPQSAHHACPSR